MRNLMSPWPIMVLNYLNFTGHLVFTVTFSVPDSMVSVDNNNSEHSECDSIPDMEEFRHNKHHSYR